MWALPSCHRTRAPGLLHSGGAPLGCARGAAGEQEHGVVGGLAAVGVEPVEGDKLELKNERRIYKAEMSMNKKLMAEANKQSTETLMAQRMTGKPATLKAKEEGKLVDVSKILKALSPRPTPKQEHEKNVGRPPVKVDHADAKDEEAKRKPIITKIFYRPPSKQSSNSS